MTIATRGNGMTDIDSRGMPNAHTPAPDSTPSSHDYKGPALLRHQVADYTRLPMMPKAVQTAKGKMDEAAELVYDLDNAAFDLLGEYKAAPTRFRETARRAVARGETPASTAELDAELDGLARRYKDTVAHRQAVEAHLKTLVDAYHAAAEKALPAWRDTIAAALAKRAEPARKALAKALADCREVYALAAAVEEMDRPRIGRYERPRVSALDGRELPAVFQLDDVGNQFASNGDRLTFEDDANAAGRLATTWLKVEGTHHFGVGTLPVALTVPVSDLPPEDSQARERNEEEERETLRAQQYIDARRGGLV